MRTSTAATDGMMDAGSWFIYEELISKYFVEHRKFVRLDYPRQSGNNEQPTKPNYAPNVSSVLETCDETFSLMPMNRLYRPSNPGFPLVDLYYKTKIDATKSEDAWVEVLDKTSGAMVQVENVKLVGINTCMGTSPSSVVRTFGSYDALKRKLKLPDKLLFEFIFCPHPRVADEAGIKFDTTFPTGTVVHTFILKIPPSYVVGDDSSGGKRSVSRASVDEDTDLEDETTEEVKRNISIR